jgi:hypothetical protein
MKLHYPIAIGLAALLVAAGWSSAIPHDSVRTISTDLKKNEWST